MFLSLGEGNSTLNQKGIDKMTEIKQEHDLFCYSIILILLEAFQK